jgi:hypothetical protein
MRDSNLGRAIKVDVCYLDDLILHPLLVGYETHNKCKMMSKLKLCQSTFGL